VYVQGIVAFLADVVHVFETPIMAISANVFVTCWAIGPIEYPIGLLVSKSHLGFDQKRVAFVTMGALLIFVTMFHTAIQTLVVGWVFVVVAEIACLSRYHLENDGINKHGTSGSG
jgi:hypothetical protein